MAIWTRIADAFRPTPSPPPRGEAGRRAYAIGDIHGRLDLLDDLLDRIARDRAASGGGAALIVFLGDYIDRGPDSAGVIDRLIGYAPPDTEIAFLAGNHEEALLRVLEGDAGLLRNWLSFGGVACAASYGVEEEALRLAGERLAGAALAQAMPVAHLKFLNELTDMRTFGDYCFVHAGIRPGVELHRQTSADLRWIREPFLSDRRAHGAVVVHGHTIVDAVDERPNRIGIDTGAFRTGILTALVIEGETRRYLSTAAAA